MRPLLPLLLASILFASPLVSPHVSRAAWPHDPYSGNVPVCTLPGDQITSAIATDGSGGAIIAWADKRTGAADIYVQRLNWAGLPQWAGGGVPLCTSPTEETGPIITSDGAGGAVVAWVDTRSGNWDLYARRVTAAGAPAWTANGVALCAVGGDQSTQVISSDNAGGAIVAWVDARGANWDIYAQRIGAAGVPAWAANGVAVCSAPGDQSTSAIAPDGAGGAIIAWVDARGASWDIYAQRISAAGAPLWAANGVTICGASGSQSTVTIAPDGAGGAVIAWVDPRGGGYDIYAQRVTASGWALWPANGVPVCTETGDQSSCAIASDGAGGAILAWVDPRGGNFDLYAQRISADGAPAWPPNGISVCSAAGDQSSPRLVPDGAGGAFVAWVDPRGGTLDIYAQRVSGAGTCLWTTNGLGLCTAASNQFAPAILAQDVGSAIFSWHDYRNGNYDVYAQRVEPFGKLGSPEPAIVSVRDVPNDQGGRIKLSWDASYLDTRPGQGLAGYDILRSVPPSQARAALARGARAVSIPADLRGGAGGSYLVTRDGVESFYWEYLTSVEPLGYVPGYSYLAPTACDSTGAGNPRTAFMVVAIGLNDDSYWPSRPDSGYSVDNLAPATPGPLTGEYVAGATNLHWDPSPEPDLAGYRLYRGSAAGFIPTPSNLVAAPADTGYRDAGDAGSCYKLSAVDTHGNESGYALLTPGSTTGVDGEPAPRDVAFATPRPNPARVEALFSFALPRAAQVRLAVYDMSGRRVRAAIAGRLEAGPHQWVFDLRDDGGRRLPSGLYFARLETGEVALARRLAIFD